MSGTATRTSFLRSSHFRATLWYTALIALLSIGFGALIYVNQAREVYGESRFRVSKEIGEFLHSLDRGQDLQLRSGEAFALVGPDNALIRASGIAEDEALRLAAAASAIVPDAAAPEPREERMQEKDGRLAKVALPLAYLEKGGMLYGYMRLEWPDGPAFGGALLFGSSAVPKRRAPPNASHKPGHRDRADAGRGHAQRRLAGEPLDEAHSPHGQDRALHRRGRPLGQDRLGHKR